MLVNWTDLNDEGGEGGDEGGTGADAAAAGANLNEGDNKSGDGNKDNKGENKGGDGKPSDAEAKLLKEVMEKKQALKEAKEAQEAIKAEKAQLAEKLAQFDGVDLEQVKALIKEQKDRETAELEKKGEWDRLKAQMLEAHTKEVEKARAEAQAKIDELEQNLGKTVKQIHELTIGRSFAESPFIRDAITLTPSKARVIYGSHFELQDGKVVAYDKPAGSPDRTMLINGDGNPLDFNKAIEKLIELDPDRDNLLRSKIKPGAGSENDPSGKSKEREKNLTGRERIQAAVRSGALKLPNK